MQFCLQSYLVSLFKRNCVQITSSYEIDEIPCSSDKFMRAVVVQYAIGRFKTWTGLDWIFGSPKGVICVSKDSIGFPKNIFGSSKEVSQIRIRVRQMMYVDQFEVFLCQIAPSRPPNEVKHLGLACVAGVQKGRGRELGRETTREGGGEHLQGSHCFRHPAY